MKLGISGIITVILVFLTGIFVFLWIRNPEYNWEPWATLVSSVAIPIVAFWERIFVNSDSNDRRLAEIEEQKLRLIVKPRIWSNGGGYRGYERIINISIDNRGELCYVDDFEVIEGDEINLNKWNTPITLAKDGHIRITGDIVDPEKHPREVSFQIRLEYHDQENYMYETVIQWIGGVTKVLYTKELPKS